MRTSEQINELTTALAKAQGEFKEAVLDCENPHFKSRYASLSSVVACSRAALTKHGLSIMQPVTYGDGGWRIETVLTHSSGQFVSTEGTLILDRQNMQGLGSAITYAKRYFYAALLGIVDGEDDDGAAASKGSGQGQPNGKEGPQTGSEGETPDPRIITKPQLDRMMAIAARVKLPEEKLKEIVHKFGYASRSLITKVDYNRIVSEIEAFKA